MVSILRGVLFGLFFVLIVIGIWVEARQVFWGFLLLLIAVFAARYVRDYLPSKIVTIRFDLKDIVFICLTIISVIGIFLGSIVIE